MITNPILPIWLMSVICGILLIIKRRGIAPYIRQIIIIILLFMINLRVQVPNGKFETSIVTAKAYVVLAVDDTISMLADDYAGGHTRLYGVAKDCEEIINELYGARFTVVKFSNDAEVASPNTNDGSFIISTIESIYPPNTYVARGTNLNVAKGPIENCVKNLKSKGDGSVILVFISDGEMNNNNNLESFASIKQYIDGGVVMGYGTDKGGKMFYQEYGYEGDYIYESYASNTPAISRINEANLKAIAGDLGVNYYNMNSAKASSVAADLKKNVSYDQQETSTEGHSDIYYFFAIGLAALLIYEMLMYKRKK